MEGETMAFTIRPTRGNIEWLKRNSQRAARNGDMAALEQWTTEGGSAADETRAKRKRRLVVYRRRK
jgi:hypothetical protein